MRGFDSHKQSILDRVSLFDVVSEQVTLRRSGRRWVGLCPFHVEKTPSFTVNPELGFFKCFGCGKGGDLFSFVQFRENVPFIEALRMLADRAGVELEPPRTTDTPTVGRADLAKVNAWAERFFRRNLTDLPGGREVRDYVEQRGISPEMAERFSLGLATDGEPSLAAAAAKAGFAPAQLIEADLLRAGEDGGVYDTFRQRLMFPIHDAMGRVVGFGGRTLVDHRAKYLNTRQNTLFDKGRSLYAVDLARNAMVERQRAIIVEGYTDCIAAHQAGFAETVATLGTALTETHVDLLRRYTEEVIVLFDSDEAGEAAAERAIAVALPRCIRVRLARIPEGKDPCDYLAQHGSAGFSDILNAAADALEFKWLRTVSRFGDGLSDKGRREAVGDFLRIVADAFQGGAVDVIHRGLMVNQVAHLLQMDPREVDRLVGGRRSRAGANRGGTLPVMRGNEAVPTGEDQSAWTNALEVFLAEPGLAPEILKLPDGDAIVDERDRRIAGIVRSLIEQVGEFRLAEVLGRCREEADVHRVAELAARGAHRGNYEATLRVALERIRRVQEGRGTEAHKWRLLAGGVTNEEATVELASIQEALRDRRHYAPRRLIPGLPAAPPPR